MGILLILVGVSLGIGTARYDDALRLYRNVAPSQSIAQRVSAGGGAIPSNARTGAGRK